MLAAQATKKLLPRGAAREVERDAFERTVDLVPGEALLLQLDDLRRVDLYPAERAREVEPVGPRVHARAQVHDRVGAGGDGVSK